MDQMVNYIQLACILTIYKTYKLIVGFSKYEFYNKLLDSITLLRVTPITPSVTLSNVTLPNNLLLN